MKHDTRFDFTPLDSSSLAVAKLIQSSDAAMGVLNSIKDRFSDRVDKTSKLFTRLESLLSHWDTPESAETLTHKPYWLEVVECCEDLHQQSNTSHEYIESAILLDGLELAAVKRLTSKACSFPTSVISEPISVNGIVKVKDDCESVGHYSSV